jgi:DNA invertase Pin-like site-specific DNA recombinase/ribosomal protein S17E
MANKGSKTDVKRVGIYARLSNEDTRSGESVSIENQKLLLVKHVKDMGWELVEIYQDDGFSGTNQNRPALQRLLKDVQEGHINTVLIKDLSRLGRNYLDVGNLAEIFFPKHGCELISLNEKLDEMAVFRNWFNEQHSRTTSVKVKAIKHMQAKDGKFFHAYAPYGYRKSSETKHLLEVDEITAHIVRTIFELRAKGYGFNKIACYLNERNIVTPRERFYQQKGKDNPRPDGRFWNGVTVKKITQHEAYIGNVVSCRYGSESYKTHKIITKPKEEWIRVENVHEPIIGRELWDKVQALTAKRYIKRPDKEGNSSIFSGFLVCSDCGSKLRRSVSRATRKNGAEYVQKSFLCGTYRQSGQSVCTAHYINESDLYELVSEQIRSHAKLVKCNEKRIVESILSQQKDSAVANKKRLDVDFKNNKKRLDMLDKLISKLYEDRVSGAIPETVFKNLIEKYEDERIERQKNHKELELSIASLNAESNNAALWVEQIKRYMDTETLDEEILLRLIDKIVVEEPLKQGRQRTYRVQIVYNYVGGLALLPGEKAVAHG